ncbi:MAG TPA: ribosome-associated translation inhibitor RaiA [bacterium]|nr:ribosome-associated translation inhibitor RaiA [bacterium]
MEIRFSGKNIQVTGGIQEHAREKILRLERYAPRLVETHVILKKEKYLFQAEMTLLAKNLKAYGEGSSKDNIYSAIDQAYARVEKQLKKYRERLKDHHKGTVSSPKGKVAAGAGAAEEAGRKGPLIVKSQSFAAKPMSIEEASLQLELSQNPFLVFSNASTKKVNVVYKREDGNHGLIEPEF